MDDRNLSTAFSQALAQTAGAFRGYLRLRLRECQLDLSAEMVQVLAYLWGHEYASQQQIARAVNRDKASVTVMLDGLARRELVQRLENEADRRSKRIVLTPQGRALQQQLTPAIEQMYATAGRGLSAAQLRAGLEVLTHVTENLQQGAK